MKRVILTLNARGLLNPLKHTAVKEHEEMTDICGSLALINVVCADFGGFSRMWDASASRQW